MTTQPTDPATLVFTTERLIIRRATVADAAMYFTLWNDPAVMAHVGFDHGLEMTLEEITEQLAKPSPGVFHKLLVVVLKETRETIGECFMTLPGGNGHAFTDVKLLPAFWGHKYGVEIKRGLVQYLFDHTNCTAVEASPSSQNIASIKMQEAVGAVRAGKGWTFLTHADGSTTTVEYYTYRVYRRIWDKAQREAKRAAEEAGPPP